MKTKYELSVSISPEEAKILQQAENILEGVCLAFEEYDQCVICPMHPICQEKLRGAFTPHSILYNIQKVLKVEEE